jgi:hypothetical protein
VADLGILASQWQQQVAAPSAPFAPRRPTSIRSAARVASLLEL